ncbi:MAG: hypothetical protein GX963_15035 [Bacteroidales bacterium]|nr:hypothetical protein [Bacteroidales bacterium]
MSITSFQSYNFRFQEVSPSKKEILDFIGSGDVDEFYPTNQIIDDILKLLSDYDNQIKGGYVIKEVKELLIKEGKILIEDVVLDVGVQLASYLKGSSYVALFLCTAGEAFTTLSKDYNNKGDYLEAYIVDSIGSLTVENAMDKIQDQLKQALTGDNLGITNRYSPGYCNWNLIEQHDLFKLIGNNPIGMSLSNSALMNPIKSVSGIIGIGLHVKKRDYGCTICNNRTCIYRKILNK